MTARETFTMTQADHDAIIARIQSARGPLIMLQCGPRRSVQEAANDAWCELGRRMGFDGMTVRPSGGNPLKFTAERLP